MNSMQTIDNVQSFLVGFKSTDGFRQFHFRKGSAALHPRWNTSLRIESLILHEEDDSLGSRATGRCSQKTLPWKRWTESGTEAGRHSLQELSAVKHDQSFIKMDNLLAVNEVPDGKCLQPSLHATKIPCYGKWQQQASVI